MKLNTVSGALILASAIAVIGCNTGNTRTDNGNRNDSAVDREPQSPDSRGPTPMTVTGCLQKSGLNTYILTRMTTPPESVGTGGDKGANPAVAERDQIRAAENAYRIDPSGDVKLDDLVGKQITVNGTIAERSDLQGRDQDATGATGKKNDASDRPEIKAGDLAKIDASSVTKIADQCSNAGTREKRSGRREKKH
jgi:hypothetical protein